VAEEAARLLEALRAHGAAAESETEHEHEHVHVPMGEAAACTYCPVCRGVVLLRSVSPETLDRLAEVATAVAGLLADLAASRAREGADRAAGRPQRARSEPIDVVDEED